MKNKRGRKFSPYLKNFFVKFSRRLIFANYLIRNCSRGFDFPNCTFRNISHGLKFANLRKPQNLIHVKINPLKDVFNLFWLCNVWYALNIRKYRKNSLRTYFMKNV